MAKGLHYISTLDDSQFINKLRNQRNMIIDSGKTAEDEALKIESMFKRVGIAAAGYFTAQQALSFGQDIIRVRGERQLLEQSFEVLLQSREKANKMIGEITQLAINSPLEMTPVANAAQTLLGFGVNAEKIMPVLRQLSDVSMGNQQRFEGLALVYAQVQSAGKLMGQDLLQMINAGFNPLPIIAEQTGRSVAQLKDEMAKGAISAEMVAAAFEKVTSEGGKFYQMTQKQADGIIGNQATFEDAIVQMKNKIGENYEEIIKGGYKAATTVVENYEEIGTALMALIVTYGTYKAALIAINALQSLNNTILKQAVLEKRLAAAAGIQLSSSEAVAAAKTKLLSIAQQGLTKSIKAAGAAMMANPYALVAAAIAAIGFATYKVVTAQDEFYKAQTRLRNVNKEVTQEFTSEIRQLNALERKLSETKKGSEEYNAVKDEIVKNYGKYYDGLDAEIEKVGRLSTTYETLVEKIRLSIGARKFESFFKAEQENLDKMISDTLDAAYTKLTDKYGKDKGLSLYKEFFNNIQHGTALSKEALDAFNDTKIFEMRWGDNAVDGVVDFTTSIDQMRTDIRNFKQASDQAVDEFRDIYKITDDQMNDILFGTTSDVATQDPPVISTLKQVVKDIKDAEITLSEMRKKSQKGLISDEDVKKQEEKIKQLKESFSTKTGVNYDDKNKQDKPSKDYSAQLTKYAQDRVRLEEDFEYSARQAKIDAMNEGIEKILAQNQINYDKEKTQIERQKADMLIQIQELERSIWEAQNPNWEKDGKKFIPQTIRLSDDQLNGFDDMITSANNKMQESNKYALDAMLSNYQNYQQRRKEINDKFDSDEKQINDSSILSETEKTTAIIELTKKRSEAIKAVNNEEIEAIQKSSDLFVRLFSDASQQSVKGLRDIISTTEELLKYLEKTSSKDITPKFGFTAEELKTIKESPEKLKALRDAIKDLNGELGSRSPFEKFANDIDKALEKIKSGDFGSGLEGIGIAIQSIMPVVKQFGEDLGTIFGDSQIGEDIGILTELIGGVGKGIQGIGQIASGDILGGVTSIVSGIASVFSMANASAERHKKALEEIMNSKIAQQREYNLLLMQQNLLYERGTTIFGSDGYGKAVNAIKVYKQAIVDLNEAMEGNDAQKKSPRGINRILALFGIKDAQSTLKRIYAGLADIEIITGHKKTGLFGWGKGKDIYSSVLDVYPELIKADGEFNKQLAQTIIATRKMSDADKESLQNMIDLYDQYEEAMKQVKDYLTGIFGELGNTMSDALVDAFKNGTDAGEAFYKSVSSMLEKLAQQMIYSVTLAPIMEKAQEDMLEIMKSGDLSDDEKFAKYASILSKMTDDAVSQQGESEKLMKIYQDIAAAKGIDIFSPNDDARESSKKGVTSMSQDSADELNGRFTAIQGHTYIMSETMKLMQPDVSHIKEMMDYMMGNAARQLIVMQDIEINTRSLSRLEYIENGVRDLKSSIDDIAIKGIKIR